MQEQTELDQILGMLFTSCVWGFQLHGNADIKRDI